MRGKGTILAMSFSLFAGYQAGAHNDLHHAAYNCDVNAFRSGLEKGISMYETNQDGMTPNDIILIKLEIMKKAKLNNNYYYKACQEVQEYIAQFKNYNSRKFIEFSYCSTYPSIRMDIQNCSIYE
ncbi:MAG: hypothetical protein GDA46_02340 [Bdellovibrionales bacterium]|nr:hypothetical protein [Bdellovibrionales bacterium]